MIGYEVVELLGIRWRRAHGALFPDLPPHLQPSLTDREAHKIVRDSGAHFVRWETDFDVGQQTEWWHVIREADYSFDYLPKKVRYLVRQGLKSYMVSPCSKGDIVKEGYEVYRRAYARYKTFEDCLGEKKFSDAVDNMPADVEFWCARDCHSGEMVAFAENHVSVDACFYATMWFCPDALKKSVSYALIHTMNHHYLGERGLRYISDGARNLSHQTQIHEFLRSKFGFRRAYCRLRVTYSTSVGILVRAAYPVRKFIRLVSFLSPLSVLLEQERIRRSFSS